MWKIGNQREHCKDVTERTILISGASIAGPALAFWLNRAGMRTVVIERAAELRSGGQTVDVRGAGREVVRRMNLEAAIRAKTTHEEGLAFVDAEGQSQARIGADAFGGEGPVAELEILRGELAGLLYEATKNQTEYIFANRVAGIVEQGNRVRVSFLHGPDREFDLVIAADGIRSKTRDLVFGDDVHIHPLGLYTSYVTIPRVDSDGTWARWYSAPGSRTVMLRPDNLGTTRALLSFLSPPRGYEKLGQAEQKDLLRRVFADAGWEAPRVLAALDSAPDFYFEEVGQVKMPHWTRGRVALVGDAAYCASPISGMGTSLALVGAYVLAGELARNADHGAAFAAYEKIMRPYVAQAQKIFPLAPRLAAPKTRAGIAFGRTVLRFATAPVMRRIMGRLLSPPADAIDLPDYRDLPRA